MARRNGRPQLAQPALDVLSVPVMSGDSEGSFSSAKDMLTDRRNRLLHDIIEACQLLESWLAQGRVDDDDDEVAEEDEPAEKPVLEPVYG